MLLRIEVGVCLVWGSGGPVRGWAPDACHAEFGIGRLKQQTTSVTVATRRALRVETERTNVSFAVVVGSSIVQIARYRELL